MAFVTAAITLGTAVAGYVGLTGLSTFALAAIGFASQAALGLALNALTPKPRLPGLGSSRGYNVTQRGSALSHQIVYGEVKTAGVVVYDNSTGTNNKFLHRVIAMTGHEIESFERIWINDSYVDVSDIPATETYTYSGNTTLFDTFEDVTITESFDLGIYTGLTTPTASTVATALGLEGSPSSVTITEKVTNASGNIASVVNPDGSTSSRYNGKLRINFHLGSPDQVADSDLVSEVAEWTSNHRLRGVAYIYCRFKFDQDAYPNGVPEIQATIKGKKLYDPRTDTTVWSDNPALCLRDYITSKYGLSEEIANIDDDLVIAAADVCDETDTDAGTTRYTCNGSFTLDTTPYDLLSSMLTSMGGLLWYAQGQWRMKPAYWVAPTISLDENDLRSSISVNTRHSRRDNFNTVRGTFRGAETNWQITDYPDVTNAGFITADGGQESVADIDLPFTDNSIEARRIGRIALERNRQQLTVQASFGLRAFALQVGDVVDLTVARFGWTNKEFEVVAWTFGIVDELDLQVSLTLRETAESIFDEVDDGVVYERDNTTLLSPFEVPNIGLSASTRLQIVNEKLTNIVTLTITSGSPENISLVETQFKLASDTLWKAAGTGELGVFEVVDLDDGIYDFRARVVNSFGVKGDWEVLTNISATGLAQPPQDVQNFTSEVNGASLNLNWTAVTDGDLSYYKIRYTPNTTITATWANSVDYSDKIARPATGTTVPARAGTFLIKAVDKSEVESVNATTLIVREQDLEQFTTTLTQTEDPTFDGIKTNCVVMDSTLRVAEVIFFDGLSGPLDDLVGDFDDLGIAYLETAATYEFSDYIDIGSVTRARVFVNSITARFNSLGSGIDGLNGDVDTMVGLWDDLTDAQNFADTNVKAYISTTDDDPAGTPTWSDYRLIRVADISARAFRFKIDLSSGFVGITPSVINLSAKVQYN